MQNLSENYITQETERSISHFCAFGYLDIKCAVTISLKAGKLSEFVYESTSEFSESCGIKIEDCDPVYCVYDSLYKESRKEIKDLINFDICNGMPKDQFIETSSNFLCTRYDYTQEAVELLQSNLIGNEIEFDDLSEVLQWFLNELEIKLTI